MQTAATGQTIPRALSPATARTIILLTLTLLLAVVSAPLSAAAVETVEAHTSTGITTQSADVQDGDVYMHVEGTGLYVDYVYTRAAPSYYVCTKARFYADGVLQAESGTVCIDGSAGEWAYTTWNAKRSFADGTQLCVSWADVNGYPCATIHS